MSKLFKIVILISLALSLLPLFFAKNSYTYSSYCLSEYWYADIPECKLDLKVAIISTIFYFSLLFVFFYIAAIFLKKIIAAIRKSN